MWHSCLQRWENDSFQDVLPGEPTCLKLPGTHSGASSEPSFREAVWASLDVGATDPIGPTSFLSIPTLQCAFCPFLLPLFETLFVNA